MRTADARVIHINCSSPCCYTEAGKWTSLKKLLLGPHEGVFRLPSSVPILESAKLLEACEA
eukprot:15477881-Alexandrium_andersonii.AAC.1